ncbi:MAG: TonB-dependent siderophore receptor [Gammaproteobacteria bacterium]
MSPILKHLRPAALLSLSAVFGSMAQAAAGEPAEPSSLEGKEVVLNDVKVKAAPIKEEDIDGYVAKKSTAGTKTNTPLNETPQSVSVVTNDRMEAQNAGNLAEALRYTPGLQSEPFGFEPRMTQLRIRGFDATENGLYVDGLKLVNPGFAVSYNLEPFGAQRVDVLRGPSSVLYGQASPGGLVNFVSKRPTFDPFGSIKFEAGSYDRLQGELDVGGALDKNKTLAARLTALGRDSATQVDFIDDNRVYVAPSLTWKPNDRTMLTFLSHYQKDETQPSQRLPAKGTLFGNINGKIPTNRFTGEPNVDKYDREQFALGYMLEHRANGLLTLRQNTRYYNNKLDMRSVYTGFLFPDERTIGRYYYEIDGQVHGFNLDNQAEINFATGMVNHTVLAGLDFQHTDAFNELPFGLAPDLDIFNPVYGKSVPAASPFSKSSVTQNQIGLYLQDQIKIDRWRIALSGRYDRADSEARNRIDESRKTQDDAGLTGRAGLVYAADNGLSPYFSFSQSFLPLATTDFDGNLFKPETAKQYEFGVKYQPKNLNGYLSVAYFDLTRQNYLSSDPVTFANVQKGKAHSSGVGLEGVASFENGLNLTASYTYLNTEVQKSTFADEIGEPLEYVPSHKAALWADYTVPAGLAKGFGIGGGVRYTGTSVGNTYFAKNDIEIPGYVLFDAAMHYDMNIKGEKIQLAFNMQNVFDKEYVATAFSSFGNDSATYGLRRMITGSIKYNF